MCTKFNGLISIGVYLIPVLIFNCMVTMSPDNLLDMLIMFVLYMEYTIGGSMLWIFYVQYLGGLLCVIFMLTTIENPINTSSSVGSVDVRTRVCCDFNVRSAKVLFRRVQNSLYES